MKKRYYLFIIINYIVFTTINPNIYAKTINKIIKLEIREDIQKKFSKLINKYLHKSQFYIHITKLELKDQKLGYLLQKGRKKLISQSSLRQVGQFINKLSIKIYFAALVRKEKRQYVVKMVKVTTSLKNALTIKIKNLKIKNFKEDVLSSETQNLEQQLQSSQSELQTLKTNTQQLKQTRQTLDTTNSELSSIKTERNDTKLELTMIKNELERLRNESRKNEKEVRYWFETKYFWVGIIILILITSLVFALVFIISIKNLATGLHTIGPSIVTASNEIAAKNRNSGTEFETRVSQSLNINGLNIAPMPFNIALQEVIELQRKLRKNNNEEQEIVFLIYIHRHLQNAHTRAKAIAFMELLGKELANKLFRKLNSKNQLIITKFLHNSCYPGSRIEAMLLAGEEVVRILFIRKQQDTTSSLIPQKLMRVDPKDVQELMQSLPSRSLAKLFMYLDPAEISKFLTRLRNTSPERFAETLASFAHIPDVFKDEEINKEIEQGLDKYLELINQNKFLPFSDLYQKIFTTVQLDVAEEAMQILSETNKELSQVLAEFMVSFKTFFELTGVQQEAILERLNNQQIAAILDSLGQEDKQSLLMSLSERRRERVQEELEFVTAMPEADQRKILTTGKKQIIKKLKIWQVLGKLN